MILSESDSRIINLDVVVLKFLKKIIVFSISVLSLVVRNLVH